MTADRDKLLSGRILDSMRDGVLALDLDGRVITFNEAAGDILGMDPEAVRGRPFAEQFLLDARFDDFNELVLRAVYDAQTAHSMDIVLASAEGAEDKNLRVSSSFLLMPSIAGREERFGVVVVFSDITEARQRAKLKQLFGAYVDPRIVEQIMAQAPDEGSRRCEMTISFIDMRRFTDWSERLDAQALTTLLNRFLAATTKPISEAAGITDKFIGDAVMACWGPPFTPQETHAGDAVEAALGQLEAVDGLRAALVAEGLSHAETFDAVVGVATGEVLSGDIGPPENRNFTVIGSPVNLAARLQEAAKNYSERIIVAQGTREQADGRFTFREVGHIAVRGFADAQRIFAVTGRP